MAPTYFKGVKEHDPLTSVPETVMADPHILALLNQDVSSLESASKSSSSDEASSEKKQKAKKLKNSIPKLVQRRLDNIYK